MTTNIISIDSRISAEYIIEGQECDIHWNSFPLKEACEYAGGPELYDRFIEYLKEMVMAKRENSLVNGVFRAAPDADNDS